MATITLKNIPEKIYADLKNVAKNSHRSINGEILFAIQQHLLRKKENLKPEEIIRKVREFRSKVKGTLNPEEVDRTINEGRP